MDYDLFFFNDTATTEIYTLSLHDALPIFRRTHDRRSETDGQRGVLLDRRPRARGHHPVLRAAHLPAHADHGRTSRDRKSTRLNSSHANISYAVFCLKKKKKILVIYNL